MSLTSNTPNILGVIEALYRVEQTRERWLQDVLRAISEAFPSATGVAAVSYSLANDACDSAEIHTLGDHADLQDTLGQLHRQDALQQRNVATAYRTTLAATAAEFVTEREAFRPICERQFRARLRDTLLINGSSPIGLGCALNVFAASPIRLSNDQRDFVSKIAMHLASAARLQRKLMQQDRSTAVEAILSADGKLEHVDSPVQFQAVRSTLIEAFEQRSWARAEARTAPDRALSARRARSSSNASASSAHTDILARPARLDDGGNFIALARHA
jgi:hypothetical protein